MALRNGFNAFNPFLALISDCKNPNSKRPSTSLNSEFTIKCSNKEHYLRITPNYSFEMQRAIILNYLQYMNHKQNFKSIWTKSRRKQATDSIQIQVGRQIARLRAIGKPNYPKKNILKWAKQNWAKLHASKCQNKCIKIQNVIFCHFG